TPPPGWTMIRAGESGEASEGWKRRPESWMEPFVMVTSDIVAVNGGTIALKSDIVTVKNANSAAVRQVYIGFCPQPGKTVMSPIPTNAPDSAISGHTPEYPHYAS